MKEQLIEQARFAASRAHCPHSKFHVGAAVLANNGIIVLGCNVENASFGLTICAERNAIFATVAQGLIPLELAVSCPDTDEASPASWKMPCGACRQVIAEFTTITAIHVDGVRTFTTQELLPEAFVL